MQLFKKADKDAESETKPKGTSMSSPRVILRKEGDPPFAIDPHSILAAFIGVTLTDAGHLHAAETIVFNMNRHCQPRLFAVPFTTKIGAFAASADEGGLPDVRSVVPGLQKLGLKSPFSVVINTMVISFDGGVTKSKILAGFAFPDDPPRILFPGNDGCIPA